MGKPSGAGLVRGGLEAGDCGPDKAREMEVEEGSTECQALGRHHLFQISPMREVSPQLTRESLEGSLRSPGFRC